MTVITLGFIRDAYYIYNGRKYSINKGVIELDESYNRPSGIKEESGQTMPDA